MHNGRLTIAKPVSFQQAWQWWHILAYMPEAYSPTQMLPFIYTNSSLF